MTGIVIGTAGWLLAVTAVVLLIEVERDRRRTAHSLATARVTIGVMYNAALRTAAEVSRLRTMAATLRRDFDAAARRAGGA